MPEAGAPTTGSGTITLNPDQNRAAEKVERWFSDPFAGHSREPGVFRFAGYAGTGKTTSVKQVINRLGLRSGSIDQIAHDAAERLASCGDVSDAVREVAPGRPFAVFAAYTGKAAHVLRRSGVDASTIHSAAYRPLDKDRAMLNRLRSELREVERELSEQWVGDERGPGEQEVGDAGARGELTRRRDRLARDVGAEETRVRAPSFAFQLAGPMSAAALIVLDEVSMVGEKMARDLLSYRVPILAIGDPAQLPPVGGGGYFTEGEPDSLLTKVERSGSDVIRVASAVREAEPTADPHLTFGIDGTEGGSGRSRLTDDALLSHDVVLCWRNAVRWALIRRIRAMLGRPEGVPVPGDRITVLSNNAELGVFNGQILTVQAATADNTDDPDVWQMVVEDDDGRLRMLDVLHCGFSGEKGEKDAKDRVRFGGPIAAATFAQAITVHKAQGSEWHSVLVVDETGSIVGMKRRTEGHRRAYTDARRWLYTAVTRAEHAVTVVRGG